MGRGDLAAWAAPVSGGGVPVPAGAAAAGDVPLQACPDPGSGVSVLAAEHPAAVSPAHCPGGGGALSRDSARPSQSCWPITIPRQVRQRRPSHTGSGQDSEPSSARRMWRRLPTSPRGWRCSRHCQTPLSVSQQELDLQTNLGPVLMTTKGFTAPEVEAAYARARSSAGRWENPRSSSRCCMGLWRFYIARGEFQTARELGEQLLALAQRVRDPALLLEAHRALGQTTFWLGEMASSPRAHGAGDGPL